jgi:putative toxin-antitoxin system antitoxin component (TIGR02293 family)
MKKKKPVRYKMSFTEKEGNAFPRVVVQTPEPRAREWEFSVVVMESPLKKSNLVLMEKKLKVTYKQGAAIAGVSVRTYQKWKPSKILSVRASDHLSKIMEVFNAGMRTYDGNERSFLAWTKTPVKALGNKMPIDLMISSKEEAELVNSELVRMEYGILC